jgi:hypothetical protein
VNKKGTRGKRAMPKRTKRPSIDPDAIWWAALSDVREELGNHVLNAIADKLQFQNDRLFENVWMRIKEEKLERVIVSMFLCYQFVTDPARPLGFDEPRRLHDEEMKAARMDSARSFCRKARRSKARSPMALYIELYFRLISIACWMEAQESFSMWLAFRHHPAAWRGEADARARAMQAYFLATALSYMHVYEFKGRRIRGVRVWEGQGLGTNYKGDVWNQGQWANVLRQAARFAEKGETDCTALESWLWWCYPVFRRYGWNTREVQHAAKTRGFTPAEEMYEANFRRYLLTRGIAVRGRRTNRESPPLAEFVQEVEAPVSAAVRRLPIWF